MTDIVIKAENLGKKYTIGHQSENGRYLALRDVLVQNARSLWYKTKDLVQGKPILQGDTLEDVWALKDVSFEIRRGEAVGIIGRNGAGKSTLLKVLSRITEPSAGRVTIKGRVASLLEVGTGFHPELTGRENIYLNGAILGMHRAEIKRKFDEIVAFAEIEKFLDTPVKRYSSGMYVRLAFAVAAHLEPEILLVDEVLAVGDASFQKKCLGKMGEVAKTGRTVLFVSHNMQAIRQLCQRTILLEQGRLAMEGLPSDVVARYLLGSDIVGDPSGISYRATTPSESDVWIETVRVFNGNGTPVSQIGRDDKLRVAIFIIVKRPFTHLNIAMALIHASGNPVFSEAMSDQHALSAIGQGKYWIEFSLDTKFLKLESYSLTIHLADQGRPLDHIDGIAVPIVFDSKADAFIEAHRWGVCRIPVFWSELRCLSE
jgi:lipopolysaccharide transport system ATP-binding protein